MRRHIFEGQKAYVEEYFAKDVASELGLSQTKLIRLAMLLGSDYTEGVNGIGAAHNTLALCWAFRDLMVFVMRTSL